MKVPLSWVKAASRRCWCASGWSRGSPRRRRIRSAPQGPLFDGRHDDAVVHRLGLEHQALTIGSSSIMLRSVTAVSSESSTPTGWPDNPGRAQARRRSKGGSASRCSCLRRRTRCNSTRSVPHSRYAGHRDARDTAGARDGADRALRSSTGRPQAAVPARTTNPSGSAMLRAGQCASSGRSRRCRRSQTNTLMRVRTTCRHHPT